MLILNSAEVRLAMLRLGVGVTKLAKLARIPPETISRAHRKDIPVQLETLARLARALEVEPPCLIKSVS